METLTVKELIELLKRYDENLTVTIYVPGDDQGFWDMKGPEQFKVASYGMPKDGKYLQIKIY